MRGLIEAVAMLALALIGAVALRVHLWEDGTLPLADASAACYTARRRRGGTP